MKNICLDDFIEFGWADKIRDCLRIQNERAKQVSLEEYRGNLDTIVGVDVSFSRDGLRLYAAACLLSYPSLKQIRASTWSGDVPFPYVEGFLAYREGAAMLQAIMSLGDEFDVLMVSGHGIAHERRCGVASHIGVLLGKPTIGVTKNAPGRGAPPKVQVGASKELFRDGTAVGALYRPDANHKFYVSVGHAIALDQSIDIVRHCFDPAVDDPAPVQAAHNLATAKKQEAAEVLDSAATLQERRQG